MEPVASPSGVLHGMNVPVPWTRMRAKVLAYKRMYRANTKLLAVRRIPRFDMWKRNIHKVNSWVIAVDDDEDLFPLIYEEKDQGIRPKDPNIGPFPGVARIPFTEDYWTRLWDSSIGITAKWGYEQSNLRSDFGKEQRCRNCRVCMWGKRRTDLLATESEISANIAREEQRQPDPEPELGGPKSVLYDEAGDYIGVSIWTPEEIAKWRRKQENKALQRKTKYGCFGHPGKPVGHFQRFSCCGRDIHARGCHQYPKHDIVSDRKAWERDWKRYEAPENPVDYRYAIALDCEMGITDLGEQELIRISAIDYFSGEVLIDKLVFPKVKMWHLNVRYSGIDWSQMYTAKDANNVINGRDEARNLLFQYLGPKTVLVMQGGRSDLLALRIRHHHVLDTLSLADGSLKTKAKKYLDREIQQGRGHDSLEDALACRDIADYFMKTLPFTHIYKRNYGQMSRLQLEISRDLLPRLGDRTTPPQWIPPASKDRVPFLKSYPRYDCWGLLKVEWDKEDEAALQEERDAYMEWGGRPPPLDKEASQQQSEKHPKKDLQEFPKKDLQEFPKEDLQDIPKKDLQEFPKEDLQEFPKKDLQEFPKEDLQEDIQEQTLATPYHSEKKVKVEIPDWEPNNKW
ncbi:hypothetical protein N7457_007536 [Penicillium paradoxum]|uniref:uncharacterized protein n=1 Tax=Penicillium paradoxum TaxID=176176 RepID=UPI0025495210|nr:uncharacterized protein N7457_007536 [Penicillium paradoxum]KAJ5779816.1 hypothetical protein N7457_007536 [Penicillium paradoxum]